MTNQLQDSRFRILMVAPQPFFRPRGTPFSVLHRIRALCSVGHSVDLVTYPFGENIKFDGLTIIRAAKPPLIRDVKIGPSLAKILLDIPVYLKTRELLKKNRYDFVHSHEEAAFFCVSLARKYGLPHIYDMHSSLPQQLKTFDSYNLRPIRKMFQSLEDYVLKSCDGVITICPDLADTAKPICDPVPHSMIENTGDDSKAFGSRQINVREVNHLEDKAIVLYTGTFESYQGLDVLLQAMKVVFSRSDSAHLILVGGRQHQIDKYAEDARQLGISDRILFTGTVPPGHIPSYMAAADMIVSPRSSGTNSPLKLYGYMRSRRPIVATNLFTHTQVLDDSTALLVPPTPEGLSEGILRLIGDRALADQIASAARQKADSEFSDKDYVRKVLAFYCDVVAHCRGKYAHFMPESTTFSQRT